MTFYDEKLSELKQKVARKAHLISSLEEMKNQKKALDKKLKLLEIEAHNEQVDVELLEGKTLSALLQGILGKKEEKLEKERAEAYAAAMKRDVARRELEDLEIRIASCESELSTLENCEQEYGAALDEKLDMIKKTGTRDADHALVLEEKISFCENQIREIDEAIEIAKNAKEIADDVISELSGAENWATFDVLGGGLIADLKKHEHLDEAQNLIFKLQKTFSCLKSELADVKVDTDIQVSIDGVMSFADYFWDNIFTDWAVLDHIEKSQEDVKRTIAQINELLKALSAIRSTVESEKIKLEIERGAL